VEAIWVIVKVVAIVIAGVGIVGAMILIFAALCGKRFKKWTVG